MIVGLHVGPDVEAVETNTDRQPGYLEGRELVTFLRPWGCPHSLDALVYRVDRTSDGPPRASRRPLVNHGSRGTRWQLVGAIVALVLLATSCEEVVYSDADAARDLAGLPALNRSSILATSARANSQAMCSAGAVQASTDPTTTYDRETIAWAGELVGSAPLDPSIPDPIDRNLDATNAVLEGWPDNSLSNARWDDIGVGEVTCADGNLYLTAVVTDRPTMPATGRYSSPQYSAAEVEVDKDLVYGTATNYQGVDQILRLDRFLPPQSDTTAQRPAVMLVHGGGYARGDKANMADVARTYARRGFVAVTINYRLNRTLTGQDDPGYIPAATNAIDDGMEAVRWMRAHAAEMNIDPERIAMMGTSAGGGIALATATLDDPTPGGPLATYSPKVKAVVATGATLTLGLDAVGFDPSDSPLMMIHFTTDTATGATGADVLATCEAMWAVGGTCDQVIRPGGGHGSPLNAGGPWWTPEIGPYLWEHLDLG